MKKLVLLLGIVVLASAAVASASPAKEIMLGAKLDSMQDHATSSHGVGTFTADIVGGKLKWKLTFSHLTGPANAAHIHVGAKGKAGNVLIPLCGPCKSGVSGTVKVNAMDIRDITKGLTYVNVHTAKYPNGEIRGQIAAH